MKNKSNFKVLGIMLLVVLLLTWVIPSSVVSGEITVGKVAPVGFADIFSSIPVLTTYFMQVAVFILFVGMFYGVSNASGSLKALVNKLVSMFKNKKWLFVVITVLFYSLLSALSKVYISAFVFVPLSIAVLLGLKYTKVQAILATVGASSVGLLAQVLNTNVKTITGADDKFIWFRLALLCVLVIFTIIYLLKVSVKKDKAEKDAEAVMFVPEARSASKKVTVKGTSLFVVVALLFVVFVLGITPWNTEIFEKAYTAIKDVKIGNFAVFASILGAFETFGAWSYNSLYATLGLATIVLSISNHLKFGEMVDACVEGAKKVLNPVLVSILINLVLIFTLNSGFLGTIIKFVVGKGRILRVIASAFIANPFMVDLNYSMQYVLSCIFYSTNNQDLLNAYQLIIQTTFGFAALVAPSSILLMVGLSYVEEKYTNWFKYIWKFMIVVFAAIGIMLLVLKYTAL